MVKRPWNWISRQKLGKLGTRLRRIRELKSYICELINWHLWLGFFNLSKNYETKLVVNKSASWEYNYKEYYIRELSHIYRIHGTRSMTRWLITRQVAMEHEFTECSIYLWSYKRPQVVVDIYFDQKKNILVVGLWPSIKSISWLFNSKSQEFCPRHTTAGSNEHGAIPSTCVRVLCSFISIWTLLKYESHYTLFSPGAHNSTSP